LVPILRILIDDSKAVPVDDDFQMSKGQAGHDSVGYIGAKWSIGNSAAVDGDDVVVAGIDNALRYCLVIFLVAVKEIGTAPI
jgi:hypothetical protein